MRPSARYLRRTDVRLVTLLGPVGVGKTRLSLAVAAGLHRTFPDGIWFVDLAAMDDPARLGTSIADRLGLRLAANRVPLEALAEHLRERKMLVILDNLEQMEAGPAIVDLLQMTTRLKILATSRRALHVRGEQEFAVSPLVTPDPADLPATEDLAQIESVALFVQCARADVPEFRLTPANAWAVAEICNRLDGLPLAIELAASRVKVMSPEEMVPRLQSRFELLTGGDLDLPVRQRSLRAAIAWSCDLLPEQARILLRRFAVFVGGATLPAVEAVCAGRTGGQGDRRTGSVPLSPSDVWSAIGALLDASLLRREATEDGEVRFTVLQTIREWALGELEASGEGEASRARHAAWAVALAEEAEPRLFTPDGNAWLRRLRREQDNLGAALEWSLGHDGEAAMRLVCALGDAWYLRGQITEGVEWLRRALAVVPDRNRRRVKALVWAGILTMVRSDLGQATALGEEALTLARELDDRAGIAAAQATLASVLQDQQQYARAFELNGQALAIFAGLDEEAWTAAVIGNLAWTAHGMGDDATATAYAERLRGIAAKTRDDYNGHLASLILGDLALAAGERGAAASHYHEVFAASWRRDDRWFAADALVGLAAIVNASGDPQRGARLLGAAEGIYRRLGMPFPPRDRPGYPDWLASIRHQLEEGVFTQAWSAGAALTPKEVAENAMTIASSLG